MQEQLERALAGLAQTTFDPTLRQLWAELFLKEQAALRAAQALRAASLELEARDQRIAALELDLAAARARVDELGCRLDGFRAEGAELRADRVREIDAAPVGADQVAWRVSLDPEPVGDR